MNYVILISHGDFANGLHQALTMFVGERDDLYSMGLQKEEDVTSLTQRINDMLVKFDRDDHFMILGDLIGGSPLTTMLDCLQSKGFLTNAKVMGGMNLAMAINAVLMKDDMQNALETALREGHEAIKELVLQEDDEDDI